ncbi:hypothetical protein [Paracoccus endophyticus]|uniref:hypothetical protein n=1 Tax=Paracoccus endophyticus TaxID=2233774 RepID=UPI0013A707C7|nr:hypothetical protein [Paracoccus endophyticus]
MQASYNENPDVFALPLYSLAGAQMGNSYVDTFFASQKAQTFFLEARKLYPEASWGGSVQVSDPAAIAAAWSSAYSKLSKAAKIDPSLGQYEEKLILNKLAAFFKAGAQVEQIGAALQTSFTTLKNAFPDRAAMLGGNQFVRDAALNYESVTLEVMMATAAVTERDAWPREGETLDETFQKLFLLEKAAEAFEKVDDPPADMLLKKGDALDAYLEYAATGIDDTHLPAAPDGNTYMDSFGISLQSLHLATILESRLGAIEQIATLLDGIGAATTNLATSGSAADLQSAHSGAELTMVFAEAARGVLGMPARGGNGSHSGSPHPSAITDREERASDAVRDIVGEHENDPNEHVL